MSHVLHWVGALPAWLSLGVLALLPLLESSSLIGLIVPGETAMLLAGVLVHEHRLGFVTTLATCALAATIGDSIGYAIGRRWGDRIVHTRIARKISRRTWDRARRYLATKGALAVLFARFAMGVRALVPMLAGMARMPYPRFVAANAAGGAMWAAGAITLGWAAGAAWEVAHWILFAVALVVAATLAVLFFRHRARPRSAHAASRP